MKTNLLALLFVTATFFLSSCQALGDIFKAGMWMGVIIVVIVIALVLWLIGKMRR
jgi:hypothetical protein